MSNIIISLPSEMVEYIRSKDGQKFIRIPETRIPLDWTWGTGNTKFKDFAKKNINNMTYEDDRPQKVKMVVELKADLKTIDPYK